MAIKVVSAGDNVNDLLQAMKGLILKEHQIATWSYKRLTYDYQGGGLGGGTSENHDMCAAAADMTAIVYGWPSTYPVESIIAWAEKLLQTRIYLQKEGALLSNIYFEHHTFEPGTVVLWAFETLAARGDARFVSLAARWREWLRAGIGYAALVGLPVQPKSWSDADQEATPKGPGVAHARSAPGEYPPPVSVAACGLRGWDLLKDHSWVNVAVHGAAWPLAEFGLGLRVDLPSWSAALLKQKHGWKPDLFSQEEQAIIAHALTRDLEAIAWVEQELIRDWLPIYPTAVILTTGGRFSGILKANAGATSAAVGKTVLTNGEAWVAGVDSPHRGSSGPSWNRKHNAHVDLQRRVFVAQAVPNEIENYKNPVVEMPLPPGEVYYYKVFSQSGIEDMLAGGVVVPSPPDPPPVTEPTPPVEQFFETGPCVGLGMISPGHGTVRSAKNLGTYNGARHTNIPGVAVWEKGHGSHVWGREIKATDDAAGWHRLLAEYRVGDPAGHRYFFRSRTDLGNHWMPTRLPKNGMPVDWTDNFYIRRVGWLDPKIDSSGNQEIGADGKPVLVQHWDAIGPFETECRAEFVGEVEIPGYGRVEAIRRTDYMNLLPGRAPGSRRVEDYGRVEAYVFARNLALWSWDLWENGKLVSSEHMSGVYPAPPAVKFFGVTPDGFEGVICTVGFKPVPPTPTIPVGEHPLAPRVISDPPDSPGTSTPNDPPKAPPLKDRSGCSFVFLFVFLSALAAVALASPGLI